MYVWEDTPPPFAPCPLSHLMVPVPQSMMTAAQKGALMRGTQWRGYSSLQAGGHTGHVDGDAVVGQEPQCVPRQHPGDVQ